MRRSVLAPGLVLLGLAGSLACGGPSPSGSPAADAATEVDATAPNTDAGDSTSDPDAGPADQGFDAGDAEVRAELGLDHGNIHPVAEHAATARHQLRGRVSGGRQEASDGRHRLRGGFVPLAP